MMQSGLSRELFESWCMEKQNGCIIAGYCVEGTLAKVSRDQGHFHYELSVIKSGAVKMLFKIVSFHLIYLFLTSNTLFTNPFIFPLSYFISPLLYLSHLPSIYLSYCLSLISYSSPHSYIFPLISLPSLPISSYLLITHSHLFLFHTLLHFLPFL